MHFATAIRLRGCRDFRCVDHGLTFVRAMGGGPRTFPGGLNKWQWKRLHEKKARDKERRLLEHEKQLYQARIRSQIRAKLAPASEQAGAAVGQQPTDSNQPSHAPMSPQEQIKALADRFMKEGAEDLWNEDDGPIQPPAPEPRRRVIGEPINLRRLISENSNSGQTFGSSSGFSNFRRFSSDTRSSVRGLNFAVYGENGSLQNLQAWSREMHFPIFAQRIGDFKGRNFPIWHSFLISRCYSVDANRMNKFERFGFPRNKNLKTEDDSKLDVMGSRGRRTRWPRFTSNVTDSSDDDDDESDDEVEKGSLANVKRMSSAALGKYDMKIKKRIPLQLVEDEYDLSQHVEEIRKEVNQRRLEKSGGEEEEESILSLKRYRVCLRIPQFQTFEVIRLKLACTTTL